MKTKTKRPSKQSPAQKRRAALKQEKRLLQLEREKVARTKQLLNKLLAEASNNDDDSATVRSPTLAPNVTLDFLGLHFLQRVVESDTFREKVRQALRQLDRRLSGPTGPIGPTGPGVLWGAS